MAGRSKCLKRIVVILIALTLPPLSAACSISPGQNHSASSGNNAGKLPAPPPATIGNAKIASMLLDLIQAQQTGDAESFAKKSILILKDGKVLVTIVCAGGQIEVSANATINAGGELASSLDSQTQFDAYVPIDSLEVIARQNSVLGIDVWNSSSTLEGIGAVSY